MGFMDKAKKMAEQAQQKLDDAQKSFNEKQGSGGQQQGGSAVEYDAHGRPVNAPASAEAPPAAQASAPPPGDPLAEPASTAPTADPAAPGAGDPSDAAKAEGDPLLSDEPGSRQGHDAEGGKTSAPRPPGGGQGMTSGDPLG